MVQQHGYLLTAGRRENEQRGRCLCWLQLSAALSGTACASCQSWFLMRGDASVEKPVGVWVCNQSAGELEIFLDYQG